MIALTEGPLLPVAGLARNHPMIPSKIVIGRVARLDAAEVGLGAKVAVCQKLFRGGEAAVMRIERHVPGIADPGEARTTDPHRLGQQGNIRQADLQAGGIHHHPPVRQGIDQGGGFVHPLGKADIPGEDRRAIGSDHGTVVVAAGDGEVQRGLIDEVRVLVAEHGDLLQVSVIGAQGDGLIGARRLVRVTLNRTRGLAPV